MVYVCEHVCVCVCVRCCGIYTLICIYLENWTDDFDAKWKTCRYYCSHWFLYKKNIHKRLQLWIYISNSKFQILIFCELQQKPLALWAYRKIRFGEFSYFFFSRVKIIPQRIITYLILKGLISQVLKQSIKRCLWTPSYKKLAGFTEVGVDSTPVQRWVK